jgi:hypothetical protein
MSKRISWERRRFDGRWTVNVRDEYEYCKNDVAAKWLASAEAKKAITEEKKKKAKEEERKRKLAAERKEQAKREAEYARKAEAHKDEPPPWDE